MKTYRVVFHVTMYDYSFDHYATFYVDSTIDLAEQIMEYEEDLDYQIEPLTITKTITKIGG